MPRKKTKSSRAKRNVFHKPLFYFWVGFVGFILTCGLFLAATLYGNARAIDIGLLASSRSSSAQAATLAVDQVNAQGGLSVAGTRFPVKLTIRSQGQTSTTGQAAAQALINEGVLAIIGSDDSEVGDAAKTTTITQEVLFVSLVCETTCADGAVMTADNNAFITAYKKVYGEVPTQEAAATYTAMQQIFSAIQKNGGFDRQGLIQTVRQ